MEYFFFSFSHPFSALLLGVQQTVPFFMPPGSKESHIYIYWLVHQYIMLIQRSVNSLKIAPCTRYQVLLYLPAILYRIGDLFTYICVRCVGTQRCGFPHSSSQDSSSAALLYCLHFLRLSCSLPRSFRFGCLCCLPATTAAAVCPGPLQAINCPLNMGHTCILV